jgi:glucose/mannose-6-phosphate isomerase
MLDDVNVIKERDPAGALGVALKQPEQAIFDVQVVDPDHDHREITSIIVSGMGGSALAALLVKMWLKTELKIPFEVVRSYDLPGYVDEHTLVIASSYSGNTEETVSALDEGIARGAQVCVIDAGGALQAKANEQAIAYADMPAGLQPRMAVIYNLRALIAMLVNFNIVGSEKLDEIAGASEWLAQESAQWDAEITTDKNYAKQLALQAVGKTGVFYGGTLTAPLAYKWKISWNENAKNVSWSNEYSEANHNEFIGWTSHPIEKPFAVFDLISPLEHPQILKRFEISDRLLSGMRPKSTVVNLKGDTLLKQLLWGSILADFVSIYLAILNHVDPTPVPLIEKLKLELV